MVDVAQPFTGSDTQAHSFERGAGGCVRLGGGHGYVAQRAGGGGVAKGQRPPAAVLGGGEHGVGRVQAAGHRQQPGRGHLRGVHADLHDWSGDVGVGVREPLPEAVAVLRGDGPPGECCPDLGRPDPVGEVAGEGEPAPVRSDRQRARLDGVQQSGRRDSRGRRVADVGRQPGLHEAGHRCLGDEEQRRHESTRQKSYAAWALPRTDPETFERVPAVRGW
nr:hypothetical protein [Nocardioides sp.]